MSAFRKQIAISLLTLLLLSVLALPAAAGNIVLNINTGSDSTVWFVSGEASLVMNGFDLTPLNLTLPAAIDRVSIAVNTPVPGASIDLLIYEDSNGGSPIDARLVSQTQVDIRQSGTFIYQFPTPVAITQPVVWIGFYLPVDFRLLADTSGSSVLTYWAWNTGSRFNVNDLASAQILGPADGSAPVNINMNGRARITAEIISSAQPGTGTGSTGQLQGGQANLAVMQVYPDAGCDTLFRDTEDLQITLLNRYALSCRLAWFGYSPPDPVGYVRQQLLYEITIFNDKGQSISDWLPAKVTHCIRPNPADIDRAVIGHAYGVPRLWEMKTTMRFGDLICAEIGHSGLLSYFVPRT